MNIREFYRIEKNEPAAQDVYRMELSGNTAAFKAPGQFLNIAIDGLYLRRPISVCDYDGGGVTIYYKVVGEGTRRMSEMSAGAVLDVLVGLGNGFDVSKSGKRPLVIGGGVGAPPLYRLVKLLLENGNTPAVILGFNSAPDVFLTEEFQALGVNVTVTTVDGSLGMRGFVTDAQRETRGYDYVYTCGPAAMMRAVYAAAEIPGQYSFEERMGCGFGACMGCTCKTKYGHKRICRDGPVLLREEIVW